MSNGASTTLGRAAIIAYRHWRCRPGLDRACHRPRANSPSDGSRGAQEGLKGGDGMGAMALASGPGARHAGAIWHRSFAQAASR